jgi:integrase
VTLRPLAARFRLSAQHGRSAAEQRSSPRGRARPADIRVLASPLYAAGLPVHCLPLYGQWQHARLDATTDLREEAPRYTFLALCAHVCASVEVAGNGLGGHSFHHGRAMELFYGNASGEAVTEVLRHRSAASTLPYATDAARLASLKKM